MFTKKTLHYYILKNYQDNLVYSLYSQNSNRYSKTINKMKKT